MGGYYKWHTFITQCAYYDTHKGFLTKIYGSFVEYRTVTQNIATWNACEMGVKLKLSCTVYVMAGYGIFQMYHR